MTNDNARENARNDNGQFGEQNHDEAPGGDKALTGPPTEQRPAHEFESTGDGYDQTQCDDDIHDGDVLWVQSERVAGFLHEAWPIAVGENHGEFHAVKDKDDFLAKFPRYVESWARAEAILADFDLALKRDLRRLGKEEA